jgi:hypothetical protein
MSNASDISDMRSDIFDQEPVPRYWNLMKISLTLSDMSDQTEMTMKEMIWKN